MKIKALFGPFLEAKEQNRVSQQTRVPQKKQNQPIFLQCFTIEKLFLVLVLN